MINYYLLTKPGIILGNLITLAAGFLLASNGTINYWLFVNTALGLSFIMASACVLNNYIDQGVDKKMKRTAHRALVQGLISGRHAIGFAVILSAIGFLILFLSSNFLAVTVAGVGFFVYVFLYSLWKCRTIYATAIGSIAGAIPPVVGYCAASNRFDLGAIILFAMLVLWQMPHFFSIAAYHFNDYSRAGIPILPIEKGMLRTKIHMLLYICGFIVVSTLLTFFHFKGYLYLIGTTGLGLAWLGLCLKGFISRNDQLWGRDMFRFSLLLISAVSILISF